MGRPVFARYNCLHGFGGYGYDRSDWLNDPERLGGGQWQLNGVHLVSPLRGWFRAGGAGDAERVFAGEHRTPAFDAPDGIEGNVGATLAFGGGTATVNVALEVPHAGRFNAVEIHGTEGTLRVDHAKERLTVYGPDGDSQTRSVGGEADDAFETQMRAFVRGVTEGEATRSDGVRERDTLAVVEAGYESIETGEAVRVERRAD